MTSHTRPRPRPETWLWAMLAVAALMVPAAAGPPRKATLTVKSVPSGALVSVHATIETPGEGHRIVAGETPLTRQFEFGKAQRLWLELEKRGFEPQIVEVTPATGAVSVTLMARGIGPAAPAEVARVALIEPDVGVIRRGFSKEHRSEEGSEIASRAIGTALRTVLAGRYEIVATPAQLEPSPLKSLWRDARTAMELLDPIRLPYLAAAPRLETRSAREAVRQLGEAIDADALLLVDGKQNEETGGMRAGKVGIAVAGTAASFASGYSRAATSGDSFFTYNVVLPSFAEGLALRALLVHCASGEVLWLDKGLWRPVPFDRSDRVQEVVADILAGLGAPPDLKEEERP
jgi:F0F1-type ATP synthase membrane subunit c/vacuolar-type H+-ATPase subunit K